MPISLGSGEWGCPRRGDAHITVTPVLSVHLACVAGAKSEEVGEEGEENRTSQFPYPFRRLLRSLVSIYSGNSI